MNIGWWILLCIFKCVNKDIILIIISVWHMDYIFNIFEVWSVGPCRGIWWPFLIICAYGVGHLPWFYNFINLTVSVNCNTCWEYHWKTIHQDNGDPKCQSTTWHTFSSQKYSILKSLHKISESPVEL